MSQSTGKIKQQARSSFSTSREKSKRGEEEGKLEHERKRQEVVEVVRRKKQQWAWTSRHERRYGKFTFFSQARAVNLPIKAPRVCKPHGVKPAVP